MAQIKVILFALFVFTRISLTAEEKEVVIVGTAEIPELDINKTKLQYQAEVYKLATIMAVDQEFGSSVLSNYERLTYTEIKGQSVREYSDVRNNYLNTYPNGIWIRDKIDPVYEEYEKDGIYWMKCTVTGYAKKILTTKVEFIARTLDRTDFKRNETVEFNNGESAYIYFKSPEKGYITIFLDDMDKVYRCIPYSNTPDIDLTVESNRSYIFFSPENADYLEKKQCVDEIEFYTLKKMEYNQFYILFSPKPFEGYFINPVTKLDNEYTVPKSMSRENFHEFLINNRLKNSELQVQIIGVTIKQLPD